jgi:hypothetical protein
VASPDEDPEVGPPSDAEDWTDEQWLEWLVATDDAGTADGVEPQGPVTSVGRLKASSGGQILGNAMSGLAAALSGEKEDQVMVVEAPSDPEDESTVHLDFEHPERSRVVLPRLPHRR